MTPGTLKPGFDPARIHPWQGPVPDDGQLQLLEACLLARDRAGQAWRRWLATADVDHENPVTLELAAYAVLRLGPVAGDSAEARRCLGLYRRAWFLSQLGLEAAARMARATRDGDGRVLVWGDLAMALSGPRFAGRIFPVRSLRFGMVSCWGHTDLSTLTAAAEGVGGTAIRHGRLGIAAHRSPRAIWSASHAAPEPYVGLRVPPLPLVVADLVQRNWCRNPPGGLRWLLELVTVMEQSSDPDALAEGIVRASARLGSLRALETVLAVLSPLAAGSALEPLWLHLAQRGRVRRCLARLDPRRSRRWP